MATYKLAEGSAQLAGGSQQLEEKNN